MKKFLTLLGFALLATGLFGATAAVTINPTTGQFNTQAGGTPLGTMKIDTGYTLITAAGGTVDFRLGTVYLPNGVGLGTVTNTAGALTAGQVMIGNGGFDSKVSAFVAISSTGVLSLPAGAVGTPALNFGGDTTSGIYRPGANQIAVSISGASVVVVNSSGVGITGGLSTSTDVDVRFAAGQSPILNLGRTPSGNFSSLIKLLGSNSATNWQISSNGYSAGTLEFTPSTVGGGTTFSTPIFVLATTGLSITGTLATTDNITLTKAAGLFTISSASGRPTIVHRSNGTANSVTDTPVFQFNRNTNALPTSSNVGELRFDGLNSASGYTLYGMIVVATTSGTSANGSATAMAFTVSDGAGANPTMLQLAPTGSTFNGAVTVSGDFDVRLAPTQAPILYLGRNPTGNFNSVIRLAASNTQTNWQISHNTYVSGAFEITPSTAGGGTSFTTPLLSMVTGTVTVSGNETVTNQATFGNTSTDYTGAGVVLMRGATKGIRFYTLSSGSVIEATDNTGISSYQALSLGGSGVSLTVSGITVVNVSSTGIVINGSTSGGLAFSPAAATAQTVTVATAAQTTGGTTLTIPDMAGVSTTFAFLGKAQSFTLAQTFASTTNNSSAVVIQPGAYTSGSNAHVQMVSGADTGLTASTEARFMNMATSTRTWAVGTVAIQREVMFNGVTLAGAGATATFTDAFTLSATPPIQGTNASITRNHTFGILDGTSAASSITGAFIVATTYGTAASSVSIGAGNINAGNQITAGSTINGASILSSGSGNKIGYAVGVGGGNAVTQTTSRTTGVTINKATGAITLVSAAGTTSWQTFTVSDSTVAATDTIVPSQKSGTDVYMFQITNVSAGTFNISFATTGGTTVEQPVFNFAILQASAN